MSLPQETIAAHKADPAAFIAANTVVDSPPLVPEIKLRLASEMVPLWHLTESELEATGLPPPYWAFAWAGGQAMARYLLDNREIAAGKRVLDLGSGSGLVGIAALKCGAGAVTAADTDRLAMAAAGLNAQLNGVKLGCTADDLLDGPNLGWDLVVAGDVFFEQPMAGRMETWLRHLACTATVLIGDPGRTYLPKAGMAERAHFKVATSQELEDSDIRSTRVWQMLPNSID